jgi:hypothetical protein
VEEDFRLEQVDDEADLVRSVVNAQLRDFFDG